MMQMGVTSQAEEAEGVAWLVAALDRGVQLTGLSGYLEMRLGQLRERNGS
jgi:hypothetical protein